MPGSRAMFQQASVELRDRTRQFVSIAQPALGTSHAQRGAITAQLRETDYQEATAA
ncbi:hypothetical protein OG588_05605 [Streptomyces prunicolor]|uniref:hypothetical protein n=1 Tax=Streptomyces prunicolor TaxID=67348 RepID=UPI003867851D|nr:hypothetical protein OG588_05605 [Streptomyces prunicolor]